MAFNEKGTIMTSRAAIESFLNQPAFGIVGVSRSGKGFGNLAMRELRRKGYQLYLVHPHADLIDGERCYRRVGDLPEPVGALLVVVPPAQAVEVVREAAARGIRHIWLQQGAESPEVLRVCAELGLETVAGECILMFAAPTGIHKAHRWVWKVLGKIAA
jgi:predicted CoA-binding protein